MENLDTIILIVIRCVRRLNESRRAKGARSVRYVDYRLRRHSSSLARVAEQMETERLAVLRLLAGSWTIEFVRGQVRPFIRGVLLIPLVSKSAQIPAEKSLKSDQKGDLKYPRLDRLYTPQSSPINPSPLRTRSRSPNNNVAISFRES